MTSERLERPRPLRPGLLWAVASWFDAVGADVQAYRADSDGDTAVASFLVRGRVDPRALAGALGGVPTRTLRPLLRRLKWRDRGLTG